MSNMFNALSILKTKVNVNFGVLALFSSIVFETAHAHTCSLNYTPACTPIMRFTQCISRKYITIISPHPSPIDFEYSLSHTRTQITKANVFFFSFSC